MTTHRHFPCLEKPCLSNAGRELGCAWTSVFLENIQMFFHWHIKSSSVGASLIRGILKCSIDSRCVCEEADCLVTMGTKTQPNCKPQFGKNHGFQNIKNDTISKGPCVHKAVCHLRPHFCNQLRNKYEENGFVYFYFLSI